MTSFTGRIVPRLAAVLWWLIAGSAMAQSDVSITKFTNGQDANTPPGPALIVGSTVNWTYVVTNTSGRQLTNISVTDDQGAVVTCPGTTLDAGFSFTCTASGTVAAGQYSNIGTVSAQRPDSVVVTASDPSHYFGQTVNAVSIQKQTNGFDADTPPGPSLPAGATVNWTYVVTNIGTENLSNITVTDDQGAVVSCPGTTLAPSALMTCNASGIVQPGQYANVGTVTATTVTSGNVVASDPSHYYGQTLVLQKRTNGVDADVPPGPTLVPGSTVTWTYEVTNPGPETVSGLTVTDDQGVVVTCPQTTLIAGQTITCSATGTVQAGQYANVGTATATLPIGGTVSSSDPSHYFGNPLQIQKLTNGIDADTPPGPSLSIGSTVNWTYVINNVGSEVLTGVTVTDDQGVSVSCPGTTLNPGQTMTCTASGTVAAGQYANLGTVEATSPTLGLVSAADPSHYFGQTAVLDFGDAPDPTYLVLLASNGARHILGSGVFLGACVDAEADALASAGANGDDTNIGTTFGTCAVPGDDEDGVTFTSPLTIGQNATVDVVASAPCTLSAWIDFTRDGDWGDAGEDIFPGGTALAAGTNSLNFPVPATAAAGATFARFRCTTDGAVSFSGEASDGEVEDYAVTIVPPTPSVAATKSDALQIDVDSDGLVDPGDTIRYTITITNSGTGDATGVVFSDTPDANTTLVNGSVTSSAGAITSGNTAGDTSVGVSTGTIVAFGGTVTITFDVVVNNPLPLGVTQVSNQGTVSGTNFANVQTDDPAAAGAADPTVTTLSVPPAVSASKSDALQTDVSANGVVDPGDTIGYTIIITNGGTGAANNVVFTDVPDANTTLVAGSVTTSAGTVTTGNTAGDLSVAVNVGTVAGLGGTVTITFSAVVNNPLPLGVQMVSNQGTVSGSNFSNVPTDDPAVGGASDPTVTSLTVPPSVSATKTVALVNDANGNGVADRGDTLGYTIVVTNGGTGAANAVLFSDTPDPYTALVTGSVGTSAGTVTTGNNAGDTSVAVNVGTLAGLGGTATITFQVTIRNTLPLNIQQVSNQGTVSGSNFGAVQTDDPALPGSSDPTTFPIALPARIPALSTWALLALLLTLGVLAVRKISG